MKVSFRRLAYNVFFRFSPILIVILLELALRFIGVGESYLIFNESKNGQYYELNPIYYRRFISPKQFPDVVILPQEIPFDKKNNTYRIFLIGDQTLCTAFPDINIKQIIPDFTDEDSVHYDIIQLVVPYTNSFAMKRLVSSIKRYDADACVIVTGGNEFYGIPQKSAWMQDIDNYWGLNIFITMKNHRFIQILDRFIYLKKEPQKVFPPRDPDEWIVAYESDTYMETKSYFERNLKKITKKAEFPVFYVSMPVNIKTQPYRSLFDDKELQDESFAKECAVLVDNADRFTIERWINDLEAWEPETAIYYYCKAMISEHAENTDKALEYYTKALTLDALRIRMDPQFHELIKQNALSENIEHIDLLERTNEMSNTGLKINRYFINGINLNIRGRELFVSEIKTALLDYFKPINQ
ncbi:MAG: tetratricopeptide repeat protein [Candidatus Marinimicrobia bacterium]|nr:tetratricopeptide repeat protein [Candidatus Neomarinimicrobiota bacterium]